jgi:hypothetical protein
MNQGVPIRDIQHSQNQKKKSNPFAVGCLGILGLLVIFGIVGECSNYNINKEKASLQTEQDQIKADRSNYAKAVKYHKAHDFDNTLKYLYNISKSYSGYSEVKKLIAINQYNKRKIESALKSVLRELYAKKLEQAFLDQGADTDVTVYGSNYDRIRIKYILSSRVFANEFGKSTLCSQIGEMGFKYIEIYGGLDNMRWRWTFK